MNEGYPRPAGVRPSPATGGDAGEDREFERLRWRCRRGMLELDLLLGRFLETGYARLDAAQREGFLKLLAAPDVELAAWIAGTCEPPDRDLREILKIVV